MRTKALPLICAISLACGASLGVHAQGATYLDKLVAIEGNQREIYDSLFSYTSARFAEGAEITSSIFLDMSGTDVLQAALSLISGDPFRFGAFMGANLISDPEDGSLATNDSRLFLSVTGGLCVGYRGVQLFVGGRYHMLSLGDIYDIAEVRAYLDKAWYTVSESYLDWGEYRWQGFSPIVALYSRGDAVSLSGLLTLGSEYAVQALRSAFGIRLSPGWMLGLDLEALDPMVRDGNLWSIGPGLSVDRGRPDFNGRASPYRYGIRLLYQGPWETLMTNEALDRLAVSGNITMGPFLWLFDIYGRVAYGLDRGLGYAVGIVMASGGQGDGFAGDIGFELFSNDFVDRMAESYSLEGNPVRAYFYMSLRF